jgi:FHS family glucose/mannose:H+ symporter-like MFS transporter
MNRSLAFSAACLGMLIFGICMISLGSVMPFLVEDLRLDAPAMGSLAAILPIGILAGSLIFGPVVDRYSYRLLLPVSAVITASGIITLGLSHVLVILQLSFFLIGFGGGLLNGATNALASDLSREGSGQKGASLSLLGVFYGIGALGIPAVLGLIPDSVDYRSVLVWIGWSLLLPAVFFLSIRYPAAKQSKFGGFGKWKLLLKRGVLLSVALVLFVQSGMESMVNNWTPAFLIGDTGLLKQPALFSLTLFVLVFTLTRLALGFLLRRIPLAFVMGGAVVMTIMGMILLLLSGNVPRAYLSVSILGVGLAAGFPVMLGIIGNIYPDWSGAAFSIVLTVAVIGNSLINYLTGRVSGAFGMNIFPYLLLGCVVLYAILLIPVFRQMKRT